MIVDFQFPPSKKTYPGQLQKKSANKKNHHQCFVFPVACIIENDISLLLLVWMVGNQTRNQHLQQKLACISQMLHAMEYLPPIWTIFNVGKFRCISLWSPGPFLVDIRLFSGGVTAPKTNIPNPKIDGLDGLLWLIIPIKIG